MLVSSSRPQLYDSRACRTVIKSAEFVCSGVLSYLHVDVMSVKVFVQQLSESLMCDSRESPLCDALQQN